VILTLDGVKSNQERGAQKVENYCGPIPASLFADKLSSAFLPRPIPMLTFRIVTLSAMQMALLFSSVAFGDSITITNIQTLAIPLGSFITQASINDSGEIAGTANSQFGFLIPGSGGSPVQITVPGAQYTQVTGINNQGTVVGYYFGTDNLIHGFSHAGGTFTPVTAGPYTYTEGINNSGDIIGYYSSVGDTATGFLLKNGVQTTFNVPGFPLATFPRGINDAGQIVGYTSGTKLGGFLRQSDGSLQTFDFSSYAINNSGNIVGTGIGPNDTSIGMVSIGGSEFSYAFSGAMDTYLFGINNEDEVVGFYVNSGNAGRLFTGTLSVVATPEPSSLWLCAFIVIAGAFKLHKRASRSI